MQLVGRSQAGDMMILTSLGYWKGSGFYEVWTEQTITGYRKRIVIK